MKSKTEYTLHSYCGFMSLADDSCKGKVELRKTFEDAYKYYVGRKPRKDTIEKFMREKEVFAYNGVEYNFSY